MTQFQSPALYQPEHPHSVGLARARLGALAVVLTIGVWSAIGAQADRHDPADDTARIELPPVVISGHRERGDGAALALASARSGVDCANPKAFPMPAGSFGVTLER